VISAALGDRRRRFSGDAGWQGSIPTHRNAHSRHDQRGPRDGAATRRTVAGAAALMTRIVTSHYRYKRRPRKRKAVALGARLTRAGDAQLSSGRDPSEVPSARKSGRRQVWEAAAEREEEPRPESEAARSLARPDTNDARKSAIVTIRRRGKRFADVPDMTPEEHKAAGRRRRCDVPRDEAPGRREGQGTALVAYRSPPRVTGGPTATTRCPRPPRPSTSRSPRSRRGSCASNATAAARS
jgi:hypothetical protein